MSKSIFLWVVVAFAWVSLALPHFARAADSTAVAAPAMPDTAAKPATPAKPASPVGAMASASTAGTAADMKQSLNLTDEQVTKLQPVFDTRVTKMDAAVAKFEAADDPDMMGFIKEYGGIKKEFDDGVTKILTPDQAKQWAAAKAQAEKNLMQASAAKKVAMLQPALKLTDDQTAKLQAPMLIATQKKFDAIQKIADGGRISMRDKLGLKKSMEAANSELQKFMSAFMSPDQITAYKAATEKKKK
jgi:hypothetical protein